ncbi:MAG: PepSY-like domain-containing protein [Muribaculaceae bacterium]|nr:PepSY-like domain-containing protein [Muribaculaceae bacterium]
MKHYFTPIFTVALAAFCGCQSSDLYDSLPDPIENFISKYWPNPAIEQFSINPDGGYTVTVKNSITATFDSQYSWTDVNGDGIPLPQMFLSDCLPSKLYDYLESGEYTGQVFEVKRSATAYEVTLLTGSLNYSTIDDEITGSQKP